MAPKERVARPSSISFSEDSSPTVESNFGCIGGCLAGCFVPFLADEDLLSADGDLVVG